MSNRVGARFAQLFPDDRLALVDRVDEMAARFDRLSDQRPSTCGAFALSYLLPALGYERLDDQDLTAEDYLAHLAGVVIEAGEVEPSRAIGDRVARGELSETEALARHGRTWYRYPVRSSADPTVQGTSPAGIARAVETATTGQLAVVPIAGRDAAGAVTLDPVRFMDLFDLLLSNVATWRLHAILNYESDQLLAPRSAAYTPDNLRAPDVLERVPHDDWGVGHFVGLAGLWRRPDGTPWMLLFDTYKERGFDGYQPQPAELVRRGLVRTDGREGGILLVVPRETLALVEGELSRIGIEPRMWSNGSPAPDEPVLS